MGGASVAYWGAIGERYHLDLTVTNETVDPRWAFMTCDWDGKIRMDPSSPYAMAGLVALRDRFDVALGNDADADRHGIVTPAAGLLNPNHFLSAAIGYLFGGARSWGAEVGIGKTLVSSSMIDLVAADLGRRLVEVPVGFKWFVEGLVDGSLGFGGEESAGASFLRRDGAVWTTDKDGIIADLLACELTARSGRDPGAAYGELTARFGAPAYRRIDAPATPAQKAALGRLAPSDVTATTLAGDPITAILTRAPGNDAPIGGLKVVTDHGWFAARPSGTENVAKVYAESFRRGPPGEEAQPRRATSAIAASSPTALAHRFGGRRAVAASPPFVRDIAHGLARSRSAPSGSGRTVSPRRRPRDDRPRATAAVRRSSGRRRSMSRTADRHLLERGLHVVVDPGLGQLSRRATLVDGDAGLVRQVDPAPADGVELEGRPNAILGHRAVLEDDPAVGQERAEQGPEVDGPAPSERLAGRLAEATVGLERRGDPVGVAGREGGLILPDHVGLADRRIPREEGRPDDVVTEQRPLAVVGPDPDAVAGGVGLDDDRERQPERPAVLGEGQLELPDDPLVGGRRRDLPDLGRPLGQPGPAGATEVLEALDAFDSTESRVVDPDAAREGLDEPDRVAGDEGRLGDIEVAACG